MIENGAYGDSSTLVYNLHGRTGRVRLGFDLAFRLSGV